LKTISLALNRDGRILLMRPVTVVRGPRITMVEYDGWQDYYEAEKLNIEKAVGDTFIQRVLADARAVRL